MEQHSRLRLTVHKNVPQRHNIPRRTIKNTVKYSIGITVSRLCVEGLVEFLQIKAVNKKHSSHNMINRLNSYELYSHVLFILSMLILCGCNNLCGMRGQDKTRVMLFYTTKEPAPLTSRWVKGQGSRQQRASKTK